MGFNKKQLQKDTKELNKAKPPAKPRDIIYDPRGQWDFPGLETKVPTPDGSITMDGVNYPVYGVDNTGFAQMMYPNNNYQFPGNVVHEYPQIQNGGGTIPVIEDAGSYNAEGFWIPDWETMKKQAKELNAKTVKTRNGSMIYFDDNWNVKSVDDNPQMKSGGSKSKHVVVKQSKIPGANKGLFSNQKFKRGEPIGLAHEDGQPVGDIGNMHNHSDNPNMYSVKVGNKRYVYAKRNIEPGEELTTDYRLQPELEQPEDFMKRGGSPKGLVRMPKPSKKGLASKAYSRSLEATNRLFTKNRLFEKPKDRKRKVFDPNAKYYAEGGVIEDMVTVINPQDLDPETLKKYLAKLKKLENSVKAGYRKGKWYPHRSFEGGSDTIAYGHKLMPGEDYSSGISEEKAAQLQQKDVLEKQKVTETFIDNKYGKGTYDSLPQNSQMLLLDYTYNGVINKFPSFVKHVVEGNKEGMLKEYERGSKGRPLKERNEWTESVINMLDFEKPKKSSDKKASDEPNLLLPYKHEIEKMTPFQSGGEYGMPLGTGVSQNFIGNRDQFKVGGIPELPLRDNRVNYNAFVNGFEPMSKMQDGGYIETELTDDEIQAYRDGGYIVEEVD